MATQNQYTPQAVSLDGGLDFITPKVAVAGGSLSNCLNFERTDRNGYSRIGGYEPYDSIVPPSLCYTNSVVFTHSGTPSTQDSLSEDGGDGIVFGYVTATYDSTSAVCVITNFEEWAYIRDKIDTDGSVTLTNLGAVTAYTDFDSWYKVAHPTADAKLLTQAKNASFNSLAAVVDSPGVPYYPVIGAVGYKDRLYAIKDMPTFNFTTGTKQLYPGDALTTTGGLTGRLVDVVVESGSWSGGDAAGTIVVDTTAPSSWTSRNINLVRNSTTYTSILHTTTLADASMAGLYVATNKEQAVTTGDPAGWSAVDMGGIVGFDNGTPYGPFHINRHGEFNTYTTGELTTSDNATSSTSTGWTVGNSATAAAAMAIDDVFHYVLRQYSGTTPPASFDNITLTNLPKLSNYSTDTNATITGIELKLKYGAGNRVPAGGGASVTPTSRLTATLQNSGSDAAAAAPKDVQLQYVSSTSGWYGTVQELTLGGAGDLWGMTATQAKGLLDSTFGVKLFPYLTNLGTGTPYTFTYHMFYAELTVYFNSKVEKYYFWNGSDDVTAAVAYYFKSEGDWKNSDAAGNIQITGITPVAPGTRTWINDNDEIRTSPNGGGLLIAKVNGDVRGNGLDTFKQIQDAGSRYQFIVSNFYADEAYDAIYGVSGAGRAFSWDGFYFTRIYTQVDAAKDMPRHIAAFQFHLILGFESGALLLSAAGNPQDFDGLNGASEIDTGNPIRGFALMQGTTLGVFCKKSIQGLVGTSIDNFSLTVLNPYEGAIEYTVADIGRPIYCSYKGISLFDQSAAYGDFVGQRLSYQVSPWLIPRLQGTVSPVGTVATSAGPICALPVRTKNQYRLFFSDGYVLTMTLVGTEQQPMFTIQAYGLYNREILDSGPVVVWNGNFVPRAEASWVDDSGAEHIHLAHWSKVTPLDKYYMYEFDKSWTFNGYGIPSYIVSNQNFFASPFDYDVARKLRLHGTSMGYAPISVFIDKNYSENKALTYDPRVVVNCSLPREPASTLAVDQVATTTMSDVATRARSFSMRFMSYNTAEQPEDGIDPVYADVSPPFVLQAMLVQHTQGKGDV